MIVSLSSKDLHPYGYDWLNMEKNFEYNEMHHFYKVEDCRDYYKLILGESYEE